MRIDLLRTDERVFLVKASDAILGPFTREELKDKLLEREITIIDEVTSPLSNWRYIREEPVFAKVVEEIRKGQMNAREDTEVGTASPTQDMDTPAHTRSLTPRIPHPVPPLPNEIRGYSVSTSKGEEVEVQKSTRPMWIVALIAFGLAVVFALQMQKPQMPTMNTSNTEKLQLEATQFLRLGQWEAALERYGALRKNEPREAEYAVTYALLLLRQGKSRLEAMRVLEETEAQHMASPHWRAQALNGQGLAFAADGEFQSALKKFESAMEVQSGIAAYEFNRASMLLRLKLYGIPESLKRALSAPDFADLQPLGSMLSLLNDRDSSPRLLADSDNHDGFLTQEIYLLRAWRELREKDGDKGKISKFLQSFLEADPFLGEEYYIDPAVYIGAVKWDSLADRCQSVVAQLEKRKWWPQRALLLQALCSSKSGKKDLAVKMINAEVQKDGRDSLIRALQAYILWDAGYDDGQVSAALKIAADEEDVAPLARVLQARFCMKASDMTCVEKALQAHGGARSSDWIRFANLQLKAEKGEATKQEVQDALTLQPSYLPLRRLQKEVERL